MPDLYATYTITISDLLCQILENAELTDDDKCRLFIETNELASEYLDLLED